MIRVRLFTYILFVLLAGLMGVATVLAKSSETGARYELARLLQEEKRLEEELLRERARLAVLASPANLERINREMALRLVPLRRAGPGGGALVEGPDNLRNGARRRR